MKTMMEKGIQTKKKKKTNKNNVLRSLFLVHTRIRMNALFEEEKIF